MDPAPRQNKSNRATLTTPSSAALIDVAHIATLGLTPRECDVMQWICEGKRDREIATILGLSARTVEKHVGHIFEKLAVETRTAAANHCRHALAHDAALGRRPIKRKQRNKP